MKIKFLKNALIIFIIIGLVTPYFKSAEAISSKGLIGGMFTKPMQTTESGVHLATLQTLGASIGALIKTCDTETTVLGTVPVPYPAGSCAQTYLEAQAKVTAQKSSAVKEKLSWWQKTLDFVDEIAYQLLKRTILDRLVDNFIQWIQRGGKGAIISDWEQFFYDAANLAGGEFIQQLGAGFLCSPFNLQVQLALLPVEKFSKVSCTLNQIVGNINSFVDDFRDGSWIAYQESWYPKNNFYGGTLIAMDEYFKTEAGAKEAAQNEGLAGKGFLSWTVDEYVEDQFGPYSDKSGTFFAGPNYNGPRYKRIKRVKTPGTVAADAVMQLSVTTPLTRLIHSEDLSAYLVAIVNASVNTLTEGGIKWLANAASRNTPPRINTVFPCAGLTGEAFSACKASTNTDRNTFVNTQVSVRDSFIASLNLRNQLAAVFQESIDLQIQYVDNLNALVTSDIDSNRAQELTQEQEILSSLQDELENNQSFINELTKQKENIENINPSAAVTEFDYLNLQNNIDTRFINDDSDSIIQLEKAKKELSEIKQKVYNNLPNILSQLPENLRTPSTIPTPLIVNPPSWLPPELRF